MFQPLFLINCVITAVALWGGILQDVFIPISNSISEKNRMTLPLAVEVKENRRQNASWEESAELLNFRSDVLTILLDRTPVKSLEIYHNVKDSRYKEYPMTARLADDFLPTSVKYHVLDLDLDGVKEIITVFTNKIYGLHYDKQVSVLIFNPAGEMLSKTPYPHNLPELDFKVHNPYSAYRSTLAIYDEMSTETISGTFSNDFNIVNTDSGNILQFSWVIDNSSYASERVHQVEEYRFESGKLSLSSAPKFYTNNSWEQAVSGEPLVSIEALTMQLSKLEMPSFSETLNRLRAERIEFERKN
ncbi:hypothetical protein [Vibrio lentus]|uniref:hypothetical protein n=2 Tax=Vibrio lentus TaxID=136468 RepID=UPI001056D855|nr:hypothetical protein [Vibrio lentus]